MSLLVTALQTMLNLRQILLVVLLRFITLLLIAWAEKETNYCTYIYRKIWDRRIYSTHENNPTSCRNGCLETCTVLVVPSKTNLWVFRFNASTSRRTCLHVPGQFRGNLTETCSTITLKGSLNSPCIQGIHPRILSTPCRHVAQPQEQTIPNHQEWVPQKHPKW